MRRRDFVRRSAALAAAATLYPPTLAPAGPRLTASRPMESRSNDLPPRLFDISLAQWSLHRTIRSGRLDALDFAPTARGRFGLAAVEYVNQFFSDRAGDLDYLGQMKRRADDAGVRSLLIMCDGEGALGDPDPARRDEAVENHKPWVDAAAFLGCHSIRVNAASRGGYRQQLRLAADGLRRLCEFSDSRGIDILVENHGGLSSNGAWLAGVMRAVDHPRAGTLPDFGNFRTREEPEEWYDRYRGVRELMPYARAVSAKSHEFGADGNELRTDYHRMLRIVIESGYRGHVGIEYEGDGLSEHDGIMATLRLLERVRAQLSSPPGEFP